MNIADVKIKLREQKDKIFIILVVIATIFIGRKILDSQKVKLANTQDRIKNYQQRIELATIVDSLDKQIGKFKDVGWQSQESVSIMGKINELASQYGIEILTFDPGSLQDNQQYFTLAMTLNLSADYFSLTKFLSAIENLEALTKITNLQITSSSESGLDEYGPIVKANLSIAAFIFKK